VDSSLSASTAWGKTEASKRTKSTARMTRLVGGSPSSLSEGTPLGGDKVQLKGKSKN